MTECTPDESKLGEHADGLCDPLKEQIPELEQMVDACEIANLKHLKRIKQLEQLCRDLHRGLVYALICAEVPLEGNSTYQSMKQRMTELGVFRGGSHE